MGRRCVAGFLGICLLLCACFPCIASADAPEVRTYLLGIYNDVTKEYLIENRILSTDEQLTLTQSVWPLLDDGTLIALSNDGMWLSSVTCGKEYNGRGLANTGEYRFYLKRNGALLTEDDLSRPIEDGDVLEWIYGVIPEEKIRPADEREIPQTDDGLWSDEVFAMMGNACGWLNQNLEYSTHYFVALGMASASADARLVNQLLTKIKGAGESTSVLEIAADILMLSFCGFDASNSEMAALIERLAMAEDVADPGIFGPINALTALDCRNYSLPEGARNSRGDLVAEILKKQCEDGGFCIFDGSAEDVDATAMAVTALSNYIDQPTVFSAVDRALSYLREAQTESGGFGYQGQETCESLSQVIIALSSVGIRPNDSRFFKEESLLENLQRYLCPSGAFCHQLGGEESRMATEQAVMALASVRRGGSPYVLPATGDSEIIIDPQPEEETPLPRTSGGWITVGLAFGGLILGSGIAGLVRKKRNR